MTDDLKALVERLEDSARFSYAHERGIADLVRQAAAAIAALTELAGALREIAQGEGELCAIRDAAGGIEDAMPRMLDAHELRAIARAALAKLEAER